jgi:ribonuclease P protein subunit RPR2
MGSGKSRFRRQRNRRRERAENAQSYLAELITKGKNHDPEFTDAVTRHMWKIGLRHRIGLPNTHVHWICRQCRVLLRPSFNARVRIRGGMRITTCLKCGNIRRFGNVSNRGLSGVHSSGVDSLDDLTEDKVL